MHISVLKLSLTWLGISSSAGNKHLGAHCKTQKKTELRVVPMLQVPTPVAVAKVDHLKDVQVFL